MSACAASILVVTCEEADNANFLKHEWPSLDSWCGLATVRGHREIHHGKVLLALTHGEQTQPNDIPCWVVEIGIFQQVADFAAVRRRLWPNNQHNGHSSLEPKYRILFKRISL